MLWQPDLPDFRDYPFVGVTAVNDLPATVDLRDSTFLNVDRRPFDSPVLDLFEFVYKKDFTGDQVKPFGPGNPNQSLVIFREELKNTVRKSSEAIGPTSYYRMSNTLNELKQCLADGYPFIFGFSKYSSFGKEVQPGKMNLPIIDETIVGSGIMLAVGYDNENEWFILKSYREPGDANYFYMPYAYITNSSLCQDFWTVRKAQ